MDNLQGLTSTEYIVLVLDAIILLIFFYKVLKNIQSMKMTGMFKGMIWVFGIWFVSKLFGMTMTTQVFGTIISYTFLAVIILFPDEFKRMLDHYGRRRVIKWNKEKLLNLQGRKAVAEAVIQLSRQREGALIVIARESNLQEEIDRGETLGEIKVTSDMIQTFFQEGGAYANGAMIIKDNTIVAANSLLDIAKREDLIRSGAGNRHLAALQVTWAKDCVAVVVSATTGKITVAGKAGKKLEYMYAMDTKQMDIHNGIDEFELEHLIDGLLNNKRATEEEIEDKRKQQNDNYKALTKEERKQQIERRKEKREKEKAQKPKKHADRRKNGGKRKKKQEKTEETRPTSRGFGGYDTDYFK